MHSGKTFSITFKEITVSQPYIHEYFYMSLKNDTSVVAFNIVSEARDILFPISVSETTSDIVFIYRGKFRNMWLMNQVQYADLF